MVAAKREPDNDVVARYYSTKTRRILEKYGPGPRVHYHTGMFTPPASPSWGRAELRAALRAAQERLVQNAVAAWGPAALSGRVLDVGCGLGGTMLHLVTEGVCASAIGVTTCAEHVPVIEELASSTGVADRIAVIVTDASELAGVRVDAAVCIEASCYLDRPRWFRSLARSLPPGGRLHLIDCFVGRAAVAQAFDDYWHTRIGTFADYLAAAHAAGLVLKQRDDLNDDCVGFWDLSLAYIAASEVTAASSDRARLMRSRRAHELLRRSFADRGIEYLRLTFQKA